MSVQYILFFYNWRTHYNTSTWGAKHVSRDQSSRPPAQWPHAQLSHCCGMVAAWLRHGCGTACWHHVISRDFASEEPGIARKARSVTVCLDCDRSRHEARMFGPKTARDCPDGPEARM